MTDRIVLKLSGEGLGPKESLGFDKDILIAVAHQIADLNHGGFQVAIVVGGGNFIRGAKIASALGIKETSAHYMGMMATIINAVALRDILVSLGVETRVQSALSVHGVCEDYIQQRCIRHLEKGRVVIVAGGTGRPSVTTDTAAALLAVEIGASKLFKATNVDGVFTDDPKTNPLAARHESLTHDAAIDDRLGFMDLGAIVLCQQHQIAITVFDIHEPGNLLAAAQGHRVGTVVHS